MKQLKAIREYIAVNFIVDNEKIIIDDTYEIQIVFPNGEKEFVDFKPFEMYVNDPPIHHTWNDARVKINFKGVHLCLTLSDLILNHGCNAYIRKEDEHGI